MLTLRTGDLFVLSWARVQQVRRGSISSELLMWGGCVCCILMPLVSRCLGLLNYVFTVACGSVGAHVWKI